MKGASSYKKACTTNGCLHQKIKGLESDCSKGKPILQRKLFRNGSGDSFVIKESHSFWPLEVNNPVCFPLNETTWGV